MGTNNLQVVKLEPRESQPNGDIVSDLEQTLEEARSGKLRGLAMVKDFGDRVDTGWVHGENQASVLIGGAAVLLSRLSGK